MAKTLYDKIWDAHLVDSTPGETPVIYIDRHLVHEVTSPRPLKACACRAARCAVRN